MGNIFKDLEVVKPGQKPPAPTPPAAPASSASPSPATSAPQTGPNAPHKVDMPWYKGLGHYTKS